MYFHTLVVTSFTLKKIRKSRMFDFLILIFTSLLPPSLSPSNVSSTLSRNTKSWFDSHGFTNIRYRPAHNRGSSPSRSRLILHHRPTLMFHVGAIRLALTFHNKKGLPVATRIALLDSRYNNYQHACLGMVETTLNSGTAVFTVFPNFTLSLKDKTWSTTFVAQIQMIGAPMEPGLVQATLHSQMAYRLQDHVFGLGKASHADIPLVQVQPNKTTTTIHIPASISRQELVALLPEAWVSNYENRRTKEQTDRNTSALIRNASGTVSSLRLLPQN
ncbi:hypothetical protein GQ457_17G020410 [Hibiscus cannabinus]